MNNYCVRIVQDGNFSHSEYVQAETEEMAGRLALAKAASTVEFDQPDFRVTLEIVAILKTTKD